jgi:trehalose 6-phosphate phosphatase
MRRYGGYRAVKHCLGELAIIDAMLGRARRILIASDFDGTLCPIAESPDDVQVAPAMLKTLRRLTASERISLAVISGRALADVKRLLPLNIIFGGNHGLEISGPGINFEHARARDLRPSLAAACEALRCAVAPWAEAWVEDKVLSATVHFRKVREQHKFALLAAVRHCVAELDTPFAVRAGKKAFEVLPKVSWNKGSAFTYIRERQGPFDVCICIGDDLTDEHMFRSNAKGLNIRIGRAEDSEAAYYLTGPSETLLLLAHIVDLCESHAPERVSTNLASVSGTCHVTGA